MIDLNEVEGLADLVAGFLFDIVTSGIENTMKGIGLWLIGIALIIHEKDNVLCALNDIKRLF